MTMLMMIGKIPPVERKIGVQTRRKQGICLGLGERKITFRKDLHNGTRMATMTIAGQHQVTHTKQARQPMTRLDGTQAMVTITIAVRTMPFNKIIGTKAEKMAKEGGMVIGRPTITTGLRNRLLVECYHSRVLGKMAMALVMRMQMEPRGGIRTSRIRDRTGALLVMTTGMQGPSRGIIPETFSHRL